MTQAESPVLVKEIEPQQANEGLPLKLLNLKKYISNVSSEDGETRFTLSLADGQPLPLGLVCTQEGEFTGVPRVGTHQSEPYSILVIAKNDADVPLIAYFDLTISQSKRATYEAKQEGASSAKAAGAPDLEDQLKEYLSLVDEDLAKEFSDDMPEEIKAAKEAIKDSDFYGNYSESEFFEMFVEYLIKKYAAVRVYDVYNFDEYYHEDPVFWKTKNDWPVKDEKVSLLTMNADAYSDAFVTGPLIDAVRELISIAAGREWECIGVMGAHTDLVETLVIEHNQKELAKPESEQKILRLNNPLKDGLWLENAFASANTMTERLNNEGTA